MILEQQKQSTVLQEGDVNESIGMSLDLDSAQFLMQTLSKNLYSDEIGSTIRETCSNALDSHRKAGVKEPIIVEYIQNSDGNYQFSVEDFGVGLDDVDVREIISKYGKSTRRGDAQALGMWGLGFKAPLAYSSSFYFTARKNGIERKYMMYEGEETNTIDLLYEKPTTERNGVKVVVPVAYKDRSDFVTKIREQLAYFEDVFFKSQLITNNFKIIRSEDYQVSTLSVGKYLHLCLDNVYYPLDFQKLGIAPVEVPIGLRFGLSDGIFPIPSRESIRYTPEAKKIILEKIKKVADTLVTEYNKSIQEVDKIDDIFNYYLNSTKNMMIDTIAISISKIQSMSSVNIKEPKLKNVKLLDLHQITMSRESFVRNCHIKMHLYKGKFVSKDKGYSPYIRDVLTSRNYLFYDAMIPAIKKEYLKTLYSSYDKFYLIKKVEKRKLGFPRKSFTDSTYFNLLSLGKYPRSEWRQRIKEYQYIENQIISRMTNIDDVVVPVEFINSRKATKASLSNKRDRFEGTVLCKEASPLERYMSNQYCKFVPITFDISFARKFGGLIIYGNYDQTSELDDLYQLGMGSEIKLKILSMSEREKKVLDKLDIHNLISLDNFMKGDSKPFKRFVTAYLIQKLTQEHNQTFYKKDHLKTISTTLYDKLQLLESYKKKHLRNAEPELINAILDVAEKHRLFDEEIYYIYLEIKHLLKRLTFLEPVMAEIAYRYVTDKADKLIPVLVDLFKYYKCRIDYTNYKISLNQEEAFDFDELLEEKVIDELIEESNN